MATERLSFGRHRYVPEPTPPAKPLTRPVNYTGETVARPKEPATRNQAFRDLARGEACTGLRLGGRCDCDPETTVLAHSNNLVDRKGRGYKASDHLGVFLGYGCHTFVDTAGVPKETRDAVMHGAQTRTKYRLHEIAMSKTEKPWRIAAARWALEHLGVKT